MQLAPKALAPPAATRAASLSRAVSEALWPDPDSSDDDDDDGTESDGVSPHGFGAAASLSVEPSVRHHMTLAQLTPAPRMYGNALAHLFAATTPGLALACKCVESSCRRWALG